MDSIKVAIIEDNKTINTSLSKAIDLQVMMELSFASFSVEEGLKNLKSGKSPNVLLLDIGLPGMSGLEGIKLIKEVLPSVDIIMLTTYDETEKIFTALSTGACSYLSKKTSLKQIMETIHVVSRGGSYMSPSIARKISLMFAQEKTQNSEVEEKLTEKQFQIVRELSDGLTYSQIAEKHNVSINTVRSHIKNIYETLQINSKAQLFNLMKK